MSKDGDTRSIQCIPEQHLLDELVKRTVEAVRPMRIILFGSAARGEMGPYSDIDLLVVMPEGIHRRRTAQTIYKNLRGLGFAKDVVVVTESDIEKYGENPSLVIYPALKQGKELYHAAG
ncbi:MAG: nucleotidyltransferase domain-containing protein [Candidatus Latescibacter sp.]|nr:nucleotidyltransferase domain-containing protein [Candidatus Latescibacter sp.]